MLACTPDADHLQNGSVLFYNTSHKVYQLCIMIQTFTNALNISKQAESEAGSR